MDRQILAWACYDWANSAYATVVMAGFFPIFFRDFWGVGRESSVITFDLGVANSLASLLIVVSAPFMGAIADNSGTHKRFLISFALLGQGMTAALLWVPQGEWMLAAMVYALATLGFMGGNIFYDALLVHVAPSDRYDSVSALGFGLGYMGGGLLFSLCILMSLFPSSFGFDDTVIAVHVSFLIVALWWLLFSLPICLGSRSDAPKKHLFHAVYCR